MVKLRLWGICALVVSLLAAAPAAAAWKRAESANFVLYSQSGDDTIRQQIVLLEDYNDFLKLLTNIQDPPPPNKLNIYMVKGPSQLRAVRNVPAGMAGFYSASSSGIAAVADETADRGEQQNQILLHEFAHHFMQQYRPLPYPTSYVEGFAEYVMTAQFEPGLIRFGEFNPGRAATLVQARWLPLDRVLFGGLPKDREEIGVFYAQSWLLAHYMLRSEINRPRLTAYFRRLAAGEDARKAFEASFPVALKDLEKELRDYLKRGMTYSRLKRSSAASPPQVTITRLPPSAEDLLLARAKMEIGVIDGSEAALLATVRSAAAGHQDSFARRVLAQAEALYGDGAKADALLDGLIAESPNGAELHYLRGMRHLVAARAAEDDAEPQFKLAQRWFGRAHKLDPNHFQTLIRYAESLQSDRRMVSDNTINILLLARDLAPQVSETAINAASLLIARDRYAEAEPLLLPLTADPHNSGLAAAAREMLAKARAGGKPAPEAEPEE
jgi:hypothetical protein